MVQYEKIMKCTLTVVIYGFVILTLLVICGCFESKKKDEVQEPVYATVNGIPLTESDLKAIVPKDFYERLTPEHKKKIVEEWINKELLYQEALRLGIDKEPEIKRLLLNSERNLLSNELLERTISDIKIPGDAELKKYYEEKKESFVVHSIEYRIRYALFDNKKDASEFYNKVKKNESFSALAKELSKDPNSQSGGNLGIVNEESVEPAVWETILSTIDKYGIKKISDPFKVIDGWACLIVDEVLGPNTVKPFEDVRDLVKDMYLTEASEKAQEAFMKGLAAKAKITYELQK